jgi:hypothetical protein
VADKTFITEPQFLALWLENSVGMMTCECVHTNCTCKDMQKSCGRGESEVISLAEVETTMERKESPGDDPAQTGC